LSPYREGRRAFSSGRAVSATILWHTERISVPDKYDLALRQTDQAQTDFANIEITLEFLIQQIYRLPTARDLSRRQR